MRNRFSVEAESLLGILLVFPLTGAVILPNGQLPWNISFFLRRDISIWC